MSWTSEKLSENSQLGSLSTLFDLECQRLSLHGLHLDPKKYFQSWSQSYQNDAIATLILNQGREPAELVTLQHQPWDTGILGLKCARLSFSVGRETTSRNLTKVYQSATENFNDAKIQYAIARVPASYWSRIHALENSGFQLLDGIVTFTLNLNDLISKEDFSIVSAREDQTSAIANLSETTFKISRFHNDELISPETAAKVHRIWAENSCRRNAADEVLVVSDANGPVGFVTIRIVSPPLDKNVAMSAVIDLIAVDARAAGQGLGKKLVMQACHWAKSKGAQVMDVQTQVDNFAAQSLYQKCGFKSKSQSFTLRWAGP